ncbi:MAG TPA: GAF domain-containing protein [Candidatus Stackebrandtia faecavium]|nr:GAF domain-containing protein [Candidatus Stackebrandtia faecavium]
MEHEYADRLSMTPEDRNVELRNRRLRELGVGEKPDAEFDDLASELAAETGAPYAMINFISEDKQYFAGLHAGTPAGTSAAEPGPEVGREMDRDHGYCPHVVVRGKALVLDDVCDYPRFAGNPVVDEIGIRSYLGAPIVDDDGVVLGTVCVVDVEPKPWGRPGLDLIKKKAAVVMDRIQQRGNRFS